MQKIRELARILGSHVLIRAQHIREFAIRGCYYSRIFHTLEYEFLRNIVFMDFPGHRIRDNEHF